MRIGKRHDPKYRVIVIDEKAKQKSDYIEQIGFYDPMAKPEVVTIEKEAYQSWIKKGAQPSDGIRKLLKRVGLA